MLSTGHQKLRWKWWEYANKWGLTIINRKHAELRHPDNCNELKMQLFQPFSLAKPPVSSYRNIVDCYCQDYLTIMFIQTLYINKIKISIADVHGTCM